jgi:hypothetical protein
MRLTERALGADGVDRGRGVTFPETEAAAQPQ